MSVLVRRLMRSAPTSTCIRQFASDSENIVLERSINQVQLLGRVGNEPQKRGSEEHRVVIFSLATHNNYKSKTGEGLEQTTDWHRICVFKPRLMETVYNYLKKGQRVYVSGKVTYGEVQTNARGGDKVTITSIIADDVIFFSSSSPSSSSS